MWFVCSSLLYAYLRTLFIFFFKQKTAYEMRISDWSSDVCSSDLDGKRVRYLPQTLLSSSNPAVRRPVRAILFPRYRPDEPVSIVQSGRASCRESVCQYV